MKIDKTTLDLLVKEIGIPYIGENKKDLLILIQKDGVEEVLKEIVKAVLKTEKAKEILGEEMINLFNKDFDNLIKESLKNEQVQNELAILSEKFLN